MKSKVCLALSLSCAPVILSEAVHAATVVVKTALSPVGAPPTSGLVAISTGSVRNPITAPPTNGLVSGSYSPEISGTPRNSPSEDGPSTSRSRSRASDESGSSSGARASRRSSQRSVDASPAAHSSGDAKSAKGGEVPQITFEDPGAFRFAAEAGYASKHLWRGIDLAQFTSSNYALTGTPKADSDVTFIGANAIYKGFALGFKYIETIDDSFNPFFAISDTDLDSYQEFVLSVNYTRMLVGPDLLQATAGFDFYYYPNDEFWGVDNQGMFYTRLSCPHYKWAQPFLELFYNVAIDSNGNGLANEANFVKGKSIRGAGGSDLVEGGGFEVGVNGGDRIYSNSIISVGLTYSLSTFYKTGYQFEEDGFSHIGLTVGAPVSIGSNLTITPSISYVEALGDIDDNLDPTKTTNFGGNAAEAWNEPGWVASVKASWQF